MFTLSTVHPTTTLNLRCPFNFEPYETSRTPMSAIMSPGENPWNAAFAYMKAIDSGRAFRIDSCIVKDQSGEHLEWYLRTYSEPEIDSVTGQEWIDDLDLGEEMYELEREEW